MTFVWVCVRACLSWSTMLCTVAENCLFLLPLPLLPPRLLPLLAGAGQEPGGCGPCGLVQLWCHVSAAYLHACLYWILVHLKQGCVCQSGGCVGSGEPEESSGWRVACSRHAACTAYYAGCGSPAARAWLSLVTHLQLLRCSSPSRLPWSRPKL